MTVSKGLKKGLLGRLKSVLAVRFSTIHRRATIMRSFKHLSTETSRHGCLSPLSLRDVTTWVPREAQGLSIDLLAPAVDSPSYSAFSATADTARQTLHVPRSPCLCKDCLRVYISVSFGHLTSRLKLTA